MKPLRLRGFAAGAAVAAAALSASGLAATAAAAPAPVQLSLEQAKGGARYGGTLTLTASLAAAAKPLAGRQVYLQRGTTSVASAVTDSAGKATFKLEALRNETYEARFSPASAPDAAAYQAATSGPLAVVVRPAIRIKLSSPLRAGRKVLGIPRGPVAVRGRLAPYQVNAQVVIRVIRGGREIRRRSRPVTKSGADGRFGLRLKLPRRGAYVVRAEQGATTELAAGRSRAKRLLVVRPRALGGSRGAGVRALQRRLSALGYPTPVTGQFSASTGRAVLAFRKVNGMARASIANRTVFRKLASGGGRYRVRYPKAGRHVEFDWSRQVLVLARGARPVRVLHASSGKSSTPTVFGRYRFYGKTPGYNSKGMYFSNYFIGGYAIHGYDPVPNFPASHGCIRIPISSAVSVYRWIRLGTKIFVYR